MIKVSEMIPDVTTMHKNGPFTEWKSTHDLFEKKRILLVGVPGAFLVEYAASQIRTYDILYENFLELGIDEIWMTSTDDCYVQNAWLDSMEISKVQNLPDPAGDWAEDIGMLEDMTEQGLGMRSHRYAMIIDDLRCKVVKYEDFTHNPMTCFQVSDAESMLVYLKGIKENYEKWK